MSNQEYTIVQYVPQSTRNCRKKEVQHSIIKAHAARIAHQRKLERAAGFALCSEQNSSQTRKLTPLRSQTGQFDDADQDARPSIDFPVSAKLPPLACLQNNLNNISVNFMMFHLIEGSHFQYLPVLLSKPYPDQSLRISVQCVALASYAQYTGRDDILQKAYALRVEALSSIRRALGNTILACKDETLAAVLLVRYFELVAGRDQDVTSTALMQHLRGTIGILRARHSHDIKSHVGDEMIRQMWDGIFTHCYAGSLRMPSSLALLRAASKNPQNLPIPDPARFKAPFRSRLLDLRASIAAGALSDRTTIIREALDLIDTLETGYRKALQEEPYRTVISNPPIPGSFCGIHHTYALGEKPSKFLGGYCMSTIWIRSMILEHAVDLKQCDMDCNISESNLRDIIRTSRSEIERVALEICASVPAHLNPDLTAEQTKQKHLDAETNTTKSSEDKHTLSPGTFQEAYHDASMQQRISVGLHLIPVLHWAGFATDSEEMRSYVIDRLEYIAKIFHLRLAQKIADCVRQGEKPDDCLLGSTYIF